MIADLEGPSFISCTVERRRYSGNASVTHDPDRTPTAQQYAQARDGGCVGACGALRSTMALFKQSCFTATGIQSLCWRGDELVDWVSGGRALAPDGTERRASVHYGYRFDAATASPDGRFAVIYERLGTKGLLLCDGKVLRELNRISYHANAYEYPVALFHEPGGRLLLVHCPQEYCRIELEEAETGRVLTACAARKPADFFHSRLAASPGGKRLLSAGWEWHPWGAVACFDVARALADPRHLDHIDPLPYWGNLCMAEESSACWLDDDRVAVSGSDEPEDPEESHDDGARLRLLPRGLAVYDLAGGTCLHAFQLDEPPGTILAIGGHHVLSLHRHPKLIELATGKMLHVWTELRSGLQDGSIVWGLEGDAKPPPMAFDAARNRFAIANGDKVTVVEFDRAVLTSR